MNNVRIKTALSTLPYREMRELGKDMAVALNTPGRCDDFAQAMSELIDAEPSKESISEQDILSSCFNRKKSFSIQPHNGGWKIQASSLETVIYTDNIRDGISQMLDHIVTIKVLE